jgi:uncharacterized delta-60 repeat protein
MLIPKILLTILCVGFLSLHVSALTGVHSAFNHQTLHPHMLQEGWGQGAAVVRQDDGKYVEAGPCSLEGNIATYLCLVRFDSNGGLDTAFGTQGIVYTGMKGQWSMTRTSLAVQPDGKILVAGSIGHLNGQTITGMRNFLIRYQPDGLVDRTFGTGGVVASQTASYYDAIADVVITGDGSILTVGTRSDGQMSRLFVDRLRSDGNPDLNFGTEGRIYLQYGPTYSMGGRAIGLQSDGKIVVAAFTEGFGAVFRILSDGSLDLTFGAQGRIGITSVGRLEFRGMDIRPDDKIVLAGTLVHNERASIAVAQLEANGSRDVAFGRDGLAFYRTRVGINVGNAVAVQSDGRILVTGFEGDNALPKAIVLRLFPNAAVDQFFGFRGVQTAAPQFFSDSTAIMTEPNGNIVVAGWTSTNDQYETRRFTLFRFDAFGWPDAAFGNNGIIRQDFIIGQKVDSSVD